MRELKYCLMCGWKDEADSSFFTPSFEAEHAIKPFILCWNCCGTIAAESRMQIAAGNVRLIYRMIEALSLRLKAIEKGETQ